MNQRKKIQNKETYSRNKAMKKLRILVAGQLISSIGSGLTYFGLGLIICLISTLGANLSLAIICMGVGVSSLFTALMEPAFKAAITDLLSESLFQDLKV